MTDVRQLQGIRVEVDAARGASFADIARRVGFVGGQPVAPEDSDQQVIDKQVSAAKAQADAAAIAAASAQAVSRYFSTKAAGEAASATDQLFSTGDGAGNLIYYRKTAGGSVEIARALTHVALAASTGATKVGYQRPEPSAVATTVFAAVARQPSVIDWGAYPDNADCGPALQRAFDEAPLGCDLLFPAPPTPDYEYRSFQALQVRRKMNLISQGARLTRYGAANVDDPVNDLLHITPQNVEDRDARLWRISGFRQIVVVGAGRNAIRVSNENLNTAQIGWTIEDCLVAVPSTGIGYAIRLDAGAQFGTHLGHIINCQIVNGIYHAAADGVTIERCNIQGVKPCITLDLVDGAFQTRILNNTLVARDGALIVLNADEWYFVGNHCEQFALEGENQNARKAQVLISGQTPSVPVRDGWIMGNNFGGGGNCEAAIVFEGNARDIVVDDNTIRRGKPLAGGWDARILAASCQGIVFGARNSWRGPRFNTDPGFPAVIQDAGTATRGIWREVTNADLNGGWTIDPDAGFRWTIDAAGQVYFDGALVAGSVASGVIVYQFSTGARPRKDRLLTGRGPSGPAVFWVRANGNLEVVSGTGSDKVYIDETYRALVRATYETGVV